MAYDRFISWEKGAEVPSQEEIEKALRRYVYDGGRVRVDGCSLFVTLPGEPRYVFREWADDEAWEVGGTRGGERGFEVYYSGNEEDEDGPYGRHIDIITRQQDELTTAVADGFEKLVIFRWKGKRVE